MPMSRTSSNFSLRRADSLPARRSLFALVFREKFAAALCCFLIWAIILGVPRLRTLAVYQVSSDDDVAKAGLWLAPLAAPFASLDFRAQEAARVREFAARHADDARVQVWALSRKGQLNRAKDWEPLLQKFPQEAWIRAAYMVALSGEFQSGRVPGTLNTLSGTPVPREKKPSFSSLEIQKVLVICQRGARLEPENSFWNWMEALFLFGARRDSEALNAIAKGSHKKYYDDHVLEVSRHQTDAESRFRALALEQKITASQGMAFPHLSQWRRVSSLATWQALQKQKRGDWNGGLQIRADVARLSSLLREQNGYVLTTLTGRTCAAIAQRAGAAWPAFAPREDSKRKLFWINHFARQCQAHNRADLTRETLRDGQRARLIMDAIQNSTDLLMSYPGIPDRLFVKMLNLNWLGTSLVMQLLFTLPFWGILGLILWLRRVPGDEKNVLSVSAICAAVFLSTFAVGSFAIFQGAGWNNFFGTNFTALDERITLLRWYIALAPLFVGSLLIGLLGAWRQRRIKLAENETGGSQSLENHFFWQRGLWIIIFVLLLVSSTVCLLHLSGTATSSAFTSDEMSGRVIEFLLSPWFLLNLLIFALAWWIFSSIWLISPAMQPFFGGNLKWFRQTLGATLVGGSVLYLALLIISVQLRQPVEMTFGNYLRRGEMATLKSSIGLLP